MFTCSGRRRECCSQLEQGTLNWNKGSNIEPCSFSEFSAWVRPEPARQLSLSLHLNSSVLFLFFSFVVWDPVTNGPLTIYCLTGLLFTQSGRTYQKFRSLAWLALTLCVPRPSADSAVACFLLQCSRCMFCMFFASRIPTCSPSLV